MMLFLMLLATATGCDSLSSCALQCDKNEAAACVWMARHHPSVERAARACNLDNTQCEWLAMEQLSVATTVPERDAAIDKLRAACTSGRYDACAKLVTHFSGASRGAVLPEGAAAAQTLCTQATATTWLPWSAIVGTCAQAGAFDAAYARAKRDVKTPQDAAGLVDGLTYAVEAAATAKQRAAWVAELAATTLRALPGCRTSTDDACFAIRRAGHLLPRSSAVTAMTKLCDVQRGDACAMRDDAACNDGEGDLSACFRVAANRGYVELDLQKKLVESCLKDNAPACFASGVVLAGMGPYGAMMSSTDAFARGCKLKDAPSCRAAAKIAPITRPTPPADALDLGNKEQVWIKNAGSGAALRTHVLVARATFFGEESQSVTQVMSLDQFPSLGGLKEGADVVVFSAHGEVSRYVAIVNVDR
jgi:hypothetical protein